MTIDQDLPADQAATASHASRTGASGFSLEICTVGTVLLGDIVDTNAAYIAQQLARVGVTVHYRSGVGDNPARMKEVFRLALSRSDGILMTGGLGPTQDDLTTEVLAELFDEPVVLHNETDRKLRASVVRLKMIVPESTFRMAMVPQGAVVMPNPAGAAPGIWLEKNGKLAIALPGVPSEMRALMEQEVLPRLQRHTAAFGTVIRSRVLRLVGIGESSAEAQILDIINRQDNPTIAPYVGTGELKLRITARAATEAEADSLNAAIEADIRERLGEYIVGVDEETLERTVGKRFIALGKTLATAESCTAGLLAAALTEMPGSSSFLTGGVVAYSNDVKQRVLAVPQKTLENFGAVSAETAAAMAAGVRQLQRTDIGISITGIAGPDGGTPEKPVGLVYIGIADSSSISTYREYFSGSRQNIRQRSVMAALRLLFEKIR